MQLWRKAAHSSGEGASATFQFYLLDEPFSHLDDNNRKKAMQLIEEEATQRNAAIILADLKPIEFFNAQRTLYM